MERLRGKQFTPDAGKEVHMRTGLRIKMAARVTKAQEVNPMHYAMTTLGRRTMCSPLTLLMIAIAGWQRQRRS